MLRCTSAGVSNCEVPDIRSNTVQRSPSTKISSWKSRATSLEESSRLFFSEIHPRKLTWILKMLVFQLHQTWQYLLSIWISAGEISSHARKQRCQKAETVTQSCRKIPGDSDELLSLGIVHLKISFDFPWILLARKNLWHSKTNKFELKIPKLKHGKFPSQISLGQRRCAPLARRAGGIAVGCPGAMLGAAVPNKVPDPRTDLQNWLPKFI